jgi:hypothetical protein
MYLLIYRHQCTNPENSRHYSRTTALSQKLRSRLQKLTLPRHHKITLSSSPTISLLPTYISRTHPHPMLLKFTSRQLAFKWNVVRLIFEMTHCLCEFDGSTGVNLPPFHHLSFTFQNILYCAQLSVLSRFFKPAKMVRNEMSI